MNVHDTLQQLLGPDYSVSGTRKLHVYGSKSTSVGTYDPRDGAVHGFAEVGFYGFDHTPAKELRAMGRQTIEEKLESIESQHFQIDFENATVDPLGLSELTNRDKGPDFLYVADLRREVGDVEEAAKVLEQLGSEAFRFSVREEIAV